MNLWLKKSFWGFRVVVILWIAFSFLGFSTTIYNTDFHEKLHLHETHADHLEGHAEEHSCDIPNECDHKPHKPNASCHACNVHKHIVTNISPVFHLSEDAHLLFEPLQTCRENFYLAQISYSFSGRAPPFSF